ncbi:hypothetical protein KKE68_04785 [Patescibacteria group bacterium]|nr:hypothetical protein [Patescibacteria group bacterium]
MSHAELSSKVDTEHKKMPQLGKVIIDATFAKNRNIGKINEIALEDLAGEFEWLRHRLNTHPQNNNVSKFILIRNEAFPLMEPFKVIINRELIYDEKDVSKLFNIKILSPKRNQNSKFKEERQDTFIGGKLIINRLEAPPSFEDIGTLLLGDEDLLAHTGVFQTGEKNLFVFRGEKTPSLNQDEVLGLNNIWEERYKSDPVIERGEIIFKAHNKIFQSPQEQINKRAVVKRKIFDDIVATYGLVVFAGRADKQFVARVTG